MRDTTAEVEEFSKESRKKWKERERGRERERERGRGREREMEENHKCAYNIEKYKTEPWDS